LLILLDISLYAIYEPGMFCPLERTLQVFIGEDRKSRSSDSFSVLASSSVHMCDLTFAYDVISILHVLFVLNK
jgi:hypothetical protein